MESKKNVVHVHTDYKFVQDTKRFEGEYFNNSIIIFKKEKKYNGPYKNVAKLYEKSQIYEVIDLCKKADLVVLYDLDVLKSKIALSLPVHVLIAWRFFGYELYRRMESEILSQKSQKFLSDKIIDSYPKYLKNLLRPIYYKFKFGGSPNELFHKAVKRINYIFIISKQEYVYLSKYWQNLPECIELHIGTGLFKDEFFEPNLAKKENIIVVGNSRNINNNHLDVIDMIEEAKNREEYQFQLLFNYGGEGTYAKEVRLAVDEKSYFRLIEEFIPKESFVTFYDGVCALIINGYRQMAMGNILNALKHGVKVYLNEKNIMMDWLLDNGIKVFSIGSLVDDIENGNVQLDQQTAKKNVKHLYKLHNNYSHSMFQKKLSNKINT